MSYILDALRRAQAERERGQVPGLHAQPGLGASQRMRSAPGTRGRPAWLWALIGAGLVALVLVPLLMMTRGGGRQQPAAVAGPAVPPGSGVTAAPQPQIQPQLQPQLQPPPLVVVAAAPTPRPAAGTGAAAVSGSGTSASPLPAVRQGTATPAPALVTSGTAGAAPVAQAPVAGTTLPAAPAAQDAPQLQAPLPSPTNAPPGARAPAALPVASSPGAALPPPLTAEQRRDWPALAVGGSVWSDSPSSRFVILGGQVVREGETTADGVLVERITPKAVVLRWRDQRGSLPF